MLLDDDFNDFKDFYLTIFFNRVLLVNVHNQGPHTTSKIQTTMVINDFG